MDDNFSPKVKDVIAYSKEEALRLGHDFIGTEHLMLGLDNKKNNFCFFFKVLIILSFSKYPWLYKKSLKSEPITFSVFSNILRTHSIMQN